MFLNFLLLLSGDIELNLGPTACTLNISILNILSLTNLVHYTALSSIAETHHIHMLLSLKPGSINLLLQPNYC
jgi:hypothetical protein